MLQTKLGIICSLVIGFSVFFPELVLSAAPQNYYNPESPQYVGQVVSVHYPRAKNMIQARDFSRAWKEIDYILTRVPNHPDVLRTSTFLTALSGNFTKTFNYFRRAIKFTPRIAETRILCGDFLDSLGQHAGALKQYEAAVILSGNPQNKGVAHYKSGQMLLKTGDLKKAKEHAQKAYELGMTDPVLRNELKAAGVW